MPYDDPDPQDPSVLVGTELSCSLEEVREMAWALAEEFARLGLPEEEIVALFRSPSYGGAHLAWTALGEVEARSIARDAARAWGSVKVAILDAPEPVEPGLPRRLPLLRTS